MKKKMKIRSSRNIRAHDAAQHSTARYGKARHGTVRNGTEHHKHGKAYLHTPVNMSVSHSTSQKQNVCCLLACCTTHLGEFLGSVVGADGRQDHAVAARHPVSRGGQAARGGELERVDRANDLRKLQHRFGAKRRGSRYTGRGLG